MEHSMLEWPQYHELTQNAIAGTLAHLNKEHTNAWETGGQQTRTAMMLNAFHDPDAHAPIMDLLYEIDKHRGFKNGHRSMY